MAFFSVWGGGRGTSDTHLEIVEEEGPLINVFLRAYFDVFRQTTRFNFRPSKHGSFYVYGFFVDSRVRGTVYQVSQVVFFYSRNSGFFENMSTFENVFLGNDISTS